MEAQKFSFTELEQRIAALPDGPAGVLNRPQWQYWADIGGGVGVIIGLLASLFAEIFEPKWWMVTMIRIGLGTMIVFFLPVLFLVILGPAFIKIDAMGIGKPAGSATQTSK